MICATWPITPVSLRNRGYKIYTKVIDALYSSYKRSVRFFAVH